MTTASLLADDGVKMPYTPTAAVSAGDVVVVGELVCTAPRDIAANELGTLNIPVAGPVKKFPKAVLSTSALTQGTKVFWDATNEIVTTTASSHKVAGYVWEAATATAATVSVVASVS